MTPEEFRDRLDAHGADLSAWSPAQRAAAEHLLAAEPAARAWLLRARQFDNLIERAMKAGSTSQDVSGDRVLAALARPLPPQRRSLLSWAWPAALLDVDLAPARLRIAVLGGVACAGIVLGLFGPDLTDVGRTGPATAEMNLAAVFEAEPLTGVRP